MHFFGKGKAGDAGNARRRQQNIGRIHVAVQNTLTVSIMDGLSQLPDKFGRTYGWHGFVATQFRKTAACDETVVDYALRFKAEFGEGTWVLGYADDMISYIPSRRVWDEGGYEGGSNLYEYGRPAFRWSGDIEDRIAATVHKLVKQVRA